MNELLQRFKIHELVSVAAIVQSIRLSYDGSIGKLGGGFPLADQNRQFLRDIVEKAYKLALAIGYGNTRQSAWHIRQQLDQGKKIDYSSARTHLSTLEMALFADSSQHHFVQVSEDRRKFFPGEWTGKEPPRFGFGPKVDEAFPSALRDINDAGYCLAVEANTAAVYHLICAAEHGLRALARDRRITFSKGPVELQQWGDIIRELEKVAIGIGNWPKSLAREAAAEFYNKAIKECRYFNEAFRRHLAHARRQYDRHEALSAMNHGKEFFLLLSERISEKKRTPLVWKRV